MIAYLDFSVSTTGMLTGVKVRLDDNLLNYCPGCSPQWVLHCSSFSPFLPLKWHRFCLQPVSAAPGSICRRFIGSKNLPAALFCEEADRIIPLKCQISLQVCFVADFTCSRQCTVPLHKAAVWTVLLSPNCHLPGPVLRSGICPVVPRKVRRVIPSVPNASRASRLHACCPLVFTQVISPSWFLPLSWRAACRCGWARSASTASETPSVPTQSWSSALKDWELRPSYWRQGERREYLLSLKSSVSSQECLSQKNSNTNRCLWMPTTFPHTYQRSRLWGTRVDDWLETQTGSLKIIK